MPGGEPDEECDCNMLRKGREVGDKFREIGRGYVI